MAIFIGGSYAFYTAGVSLINLASDYLTKKALFKPTLVSMKGNNMKKTTAYVITTVNVYCIAQ